MRALAIIGVWLCSAVHAPFLTPDFSGTWTVDRARSESQLPIPDFDLLIAQRGPVIAVESRFRTPDGLRIVHDTAVADGKEAPYTFRRYNGQEGVGLRTSRWAPDGTALEIADSVLLDAPPGPMPRWTTQRWTLGAEGATLTQEITVRQPFVSVPIKYVFARSRT